MNTTLKLPAEVLVDWLFVLLPKCLGNVVVKRRNEKQNTEKKTTPFVGARIEI